MSIETAMKELQRKREALITDKTALERQAKATEDDIAVIQRAMKLLDPAVAEEAAVVSSARAAIRAAFGRKELNRAILDALREAGHPIQAAEAADLILAARLPNATPDVTRQLSCDRT